MTVSLPVKNLGKPLYLGTVGVPRPMVSDYGMRNHTSSPPSDSLCLIFLHGRWGVFGYNAGEVHRGSAPPVHLLSPRAVPLGACPVRGHEPSGRNDAGGSGEALGERGFEVVPRQARHAGGAGLVPREGEGRFFVCWRRIWLFCVVSCKCVDIYIYYIYCIIHIYIYIYITTLRPQTGPVG